MFDFFSLMVAIVALIVARKTFNKIAALKARLYTLERSLAPASAAATVPPPLAPHREPEQVIPEPPPAIAADQPVPAVETEPAAPVARALAATRQDAARAALTPPPLPPLPRPPDT